MSPMVFHPVVLTSGRVRQTVPANNNNRDELTFVVLAQ
jgi:hypothetical protein